MIKRAKGEAAARLALSVGCPCGVGPEVSVAAAAKSKAARVLLVSSMAAVVRAARAKKIATSRFVLLDDPDDAWTLPAGKLGVWNPVADRYDAPGAFGAPTAKDGAAQLAWIDAACDLAAAGRADAMVTGPVSKEVIAGSKAPGAARFLGHTEHLQRRLHSREVVMAFAGETFSTSLVTTHLPLAKVPRAITAEAVARSAYWLAWLCLARKGTRGNVRIAVASLNPHAGEGGLLGGEEERAIAPGILRAARRLGPLAARVAFDGPLGAETAYRKASRGAYDGVVAMYHDQATIPMKLLGFGEAVNVSLGLPIVRTSVDHGTGYDIAGKGLADPTGMAHALALGARLARVPPAPSR
jgi:4-hydroxythreonine-4-phosphate dehydrogenase